MAEEYQGRHIFFYCVPGSRYRRFPWCIASWCKPWWPGPRSIRPRRVCGKSVNSVRRWPSRRSWPACRPTCSTGAQFAFSHSAGTAQASGQAAASARAKANALATHEFARPDGVAHRCSHRVANGERGQPDPQFCRHFDPGSRGADLALDVGQFGPVECPAKPDLLYFR